MAEIEPKEAQLKEAPAFIQAGTVYQAIVGDSHMGFCTDEVEALRIIKEFSPDAIPSVGFWNGMSPLPKGRYHIQPRTLLTADKDRAEALREQLGGKK